ncbi:Ubiquitin-like-specific protease 1A [Raphanus sativus]|nr:Ubiquitin-like-specific protease 1A [Raphanus sativus]
MAPGNYRYPQVKTPFRRQVHAPSPVTKFGLFAWTREVESNRSSTTRNYKSLERNALDLPLRRYNRTDREVIDVDDDELQYVEEKESLLVDAVTDVSSFEAYRKALKSAEKRTSELKDRGFGDALRERCRGLITSLRSFLIQDEEETVVEDVRREPFQPLSKEDETAVKQALSANNVQNILVTHENSNIDVTGGKLRLS